MAKNNVKITANVVDTVPPTVAGADRHPAWHALRTVAGRITTPLLPDDYLHLANPLWSARELRGRIVEVRAKPRIPPLWSSSRAGASRSTTSRASTSASVC